MDEEAVIDASVAYKLIVEEEHTDAAEALFSELAGRGVTRIAPQMFPFEITNALHKRVAGGEMTLQAAILAFRGLAKYQIELHATDDLHERALELADLLQQGAVYDSHYLALAEARDCEFWTADHRFYNAIQRVSGPLADHARWLADFNSDA